jgi:hypothetical protein
MQKLAFSSGLSKSFVRHLRLFLVIEIKFQLAEVFPKLSQKFKVLQNLSGVSTLQSVNGYVLTGPSLQ